jgi:hypothetical protein
VRRPATIRHQSNRELRSTIREEGGLDIPIVQEADRPTEGFVCRVELQSLGRGIPTRDPSVEGEADNRVCRALNEPSAV